MRTRIPTSIQAEIHKAQQTARRPAQLGSNPQKETIKGHNDLMYKILGLPFLGDPDGPCTQGAIKTNSRGARARSQPPWLSVHKNRQK